jgi:hypothetical protein
MLWRLISKKQEWWKKVLWEKYFRGSRLRCVECLVKEIRGSPIQKLLKKVIWVILKKLTWISENGKRIRIWEDSIFEKKNLSQRGDLSPLLMIAAS